MRLSRVVCILMALQLNAPMAHAFSIASGLTFGCHESISLDAFDAFFLEQPTNGIPVSDGETWRELSRFFRETFPQLVGTDLDPETLDDARRFMLVSLLVGVRSPDTDGHSALNLDNLRLLHSDPSPEGQYRHALRGPDDDAETGNGTVISGTRDVLRRLIDEATALEDPLRQDELTALRPFYLDFYGVIQTEVYLPMFLLGQAAHALQDSFSHSIRDDSDQARARGEAFRQVVHVMNYVDAIGVNFDEARDGLAHSDSMDDCLGDTDGVVAAARQATFDLFVAYRAQRKGLDAGAVGALLDRWLTLRDGCVADNGFCGNEHWVGVARQSQTEPYLKSIFGCQVGGKADHRAALGALIGLCLIGLRSRRGV